jgi:hypothetical protein
LTKVQESASTLKSSLLDTKLEGKAVKVVYQPVDKLKLLFRLENLMDPFDSDSITVPVNMSSLVDSLWAASNPGTVRPTYNLGETSVTGNMYTKEMEDRRINWLTVNDGTESKGLHKGFSGDLVYLEPMRLRTFLLEYSPTQDAEFI